MNEYYQGIGHRKLKGGPFFLGMLSFILCVSVVMAVFVPFPLALIHVLYGRAKGFLVGALVAGLSFVIGQELSYGTFLFWPYLFGLLVSFLLSEIVQRKMHPVRGFMTFGIPLALLIGGLVLGRLWLQPQNLEVAIKKNIAEISKELKKDEAQLVEMQGEEAREFFDMMAKPDKVVKEVLAFLPRALFVGIFFLFWVNLLLLLRAVHLYRWKTMYPFSEKDLLRFRVPDWLIWPVIASLLMVLLGEDYGGEKIYYVGKDLLYVFGLFYFFQGFGIFNELLDFLRVRGPIRSLMIILMVISGYWAIAAVGLFDLWVNFRRFFVVRKDKDKDKE